MKLLFGEMGDEAELYGQGVEDSAFKMEYSLMTVNDQLALMQDTSNVALPKMIDDFANLAQQIYECYNGLMEYNQGLEDVGNTFLENFDMMMNWVLELTYAYNDLAKQSNEDWDSMEQRMRDFLFYVENVFQPGITDVYDALIRKHKEFTSLTFRDILVRVAAFVEAMKLYIDDLIMNGYQRLMEESDRLQRNITANFCMMSQAALNFANVMEAVRDRVLNALLEIQKAAEAAVQAMEIACEAAKQAELCAISAAASAQSAVASASAAADAAAAAQASAAEAASSAGAACEAASAAADCEASAGSAASAAMSAAGEACAAAAEASSCESSAGGASGGGGSTGGAGIGRNTGKGGASSIASSAIAGAVSGASSKGSSSSSSKGSSSSSSRPSSGGGGGSHAGNTVLSIFAKGIEGGPATQTGTYWLDGTPTNPEYVLTSTQMSNFVRNMSRSVPPIGTQNNDNHTDNGMVIKDCVFPLNNVREPRDFQSALKQMAKQNRK